MKDIGKYHHSRSHTRPLSEFFRSAPYLRLHAHLLAQGLSEQDIVQRTPPHRGQTSEARVHPLVAMEYLRWVDYPAYCDAITALLEPRDAG